MPSLRDPMCSPSSRLVCRLCRRRVSAGSAALLLAESTAAVCSVGAVLPFRLCSRLLLCARRWVLHPLSQRQPHRGRMATGW